MDEDIPDRKPSASAADAREEAFEPQIHHKVHDEAPEENEEQEYESVQTETIRRSETSFRFYLHFLF